MELDTKTAAALARVKAAAAADQDDNVELDARDVLALLAVPAAGATEIGKGLAEPARAAGRSKTREIVLHRTAHLEPLLAAFEG